MLILFIQFATVSNEIDSSVHHMTENMKKIKSNSLSSLYLHNKSSTTKNNWHDMVFPKTRLHIFCSRISRFCIFVELRNCFFLE